MLAIMGAEPDEFKTLQTARLRQTCMFITS